MATTFDDLAQEIAALTATVATLAIDVGRVADLAADVAALRIEVTRCQTMIQEQSETLDVRRQDMAFVGTRMIALSDQLESAHNRAELLMEKADDIVKGRR